MALTPPNPGSLPLMPTMPNQPKDINQVIEWIAAFETNYVGEYTDFSQRLQNYISNAGQTTITGAATTAAVTFGGPEADTSYYVLATITAVTDATPVAGSTTMWVTGKATTGFTLNLEAAPGGTDSVTVDWAVLR